MDRVSISVIFVNGDVWGQQLEHLLESEEGVELVD